MIGSQTILGFDTLKIWRSPGQVFCPSIVFVLLFSGGWSGVTRFGEEDPNRDKMPFSSCQSGYMPAMGPRADDGTWITWPLFYSTMDIPLPEEPKLKRLAIWSIGQAGEPLEHPCIADGNANWSSHVWAFPCGAAQEESVPMSALKDSALECSQRLYSRWMATGNYLNVLPEESG